MFKAPDDKNYQFIHLVFKDRRRPFGHSSVGLAKKDDKGNLQLIFKVGLFANGQLQLEDFIKPKLGRQFYMRAYPASEKQRTNFFLIVNRRAENPSEKMKSSPSGPSYQKMLFNCRDYVESLFRKLGVETSSKRGLKVPSNTPDLVKIAITVNKDGTTQIHSNPSKEYLIAKLDEYIAERKSEKDYIGFFRGLTGHNKGIKLAAAKKQRTALKEGSSACLTKLESRAARSSRLGKITADIDQFTYSKQNIPNPLS